jgi:hypothetical protein
VFNVTRQCWFKIGQALKGIENCAFGWVEEGKTIRDLTLAEAVNLRNERALLRSEPLPYHEIPGIIYEPAKRNEKQHFASNDLVWQAHKFAREARA